MEHGDHIDLDTFLNEDFVEWDPAAQTEPDSPPFRGTYEDIGYQTVHYKLMSYEYPDGHKVYRIVNRELDQTEFEDMILPRAINQMLHFQASLEEARSEYFRGNVKLVEDNSEDPDQSGGPRLH